MTFQSDKTGKHLRSQILEAGAEERMRALQALTCGYGEGSQAALSSLLLAALGGSSTMGDNVAVEDGDPQRRGTLSFAVVEQVAEPMLSSANDPSHDSIEASSAS